MCRSSTVSSKRLTLSDLSDDQLDATARLYEYDHTLLIAGMGAGKTVVALTAIQELLVGGDLKRVLVLAPLKVAQTVWASECMEWEHLSGVNMALALGTPKERVAAFLSTADIVVMNFENLQWAANAGWLQEFDGLVVDESTKLKGGGAGFKKMRRHIKNFKWRVAMSGTPLSENWQQIFYQVMIVDDGRTLGKNRDNFMQRFFYTTDYHKRNWVLKDGAAEQLTGALAQLCHTIPPYQHTLPPLTIEHVPVPLNAESRKMYDDMAGQMSAGNVVADTAAVQIMKLQQISNGFMYDEVGETIQIHDSKILELRRRKIGKTVVVYYFNEDLIRLRAAYPDAAVLGEKNKVIENVSDWNSGKIDTLLLHPMSGGHGLNLAAGGHHMIWIAPCWSRDLFDQTIARLWRRGQRSPVTVEVLTGVDTVDEIINARLSGKSEIMPLFLDHLQKHAPLITV